MSDIIEINGKSYIVITQAELDRLLEKERHEGVIAGYNRGCEIMKREFERSELKVDGSVV